MKTRAIFLLILSATALAAVMAPVTSLAAGQARAVDIRGVWVGEAQGSIFGAEGSVTITRQRGGEISGIVEGGNVFGTAKFGIRGRVHGNAIYGNMDGNHFQGRVYADGTIRGALKAVDGDTYQVFLRRSYPYWNVNPYGAPSGMPRGSW